MANLGYVPAELFWQCRISGNYAENAARLKECFTVRRIDGKGKQGIIEKSKGDFLRSSITQNT